jgi:2-oxo-4-hydroxy-4-carboxy-5-ureidoimidazoline decarboxylase
MSDSIDHLNSLDAVSAQNALLQLCGSSRWAGMMAASRRFASSDALHAAADEHFELLDRDDWLEAFAHHPRIGDVENLRARFGATAAWSQGEQQGMDAAADDVIEALAEGNRHYEARFGHVFLVCATGKTAPEMLALLQARMHNAPDDELRIAASEQRKITHLRIDKLVQEGIQA